MKTQQRQIKERLEILRKRRNWLWFRVKEAEEKGQDLNWDKREASALDWALDLIEPTLKPKGEEGK